ncbi:MAG: hypothetical protein ABI702_20960 [Burkholderiales bacterium]
MPSTHSQLSPREEASQSFVGDQDVRRPLVSIAQLVENYPCLTTGAVRAHVFAAAQRVSSKGLIPGNGLAPAIIRKGRRVLLDEIGYFTWVRTGNVDAFLLPNSKSAAANAEASK